MDFFTQKSKRQKNAHIGDILSTTAELYTKKHQDSKLSERLNQIKQ